MTEYCLYHENHMQKVANVSFRDLVSEIHDTNYLTHGLFYYPAKFIPHVPHYCIRHFCSEGDWVMDPFAGSGTVGLEAMIAKRNSILIDINPLLKHIVDLKINFKRLDIGEIELFRKLQEMFESESEFTPEWPNIEYWYAPEVLDVLKKYWSWIHQHSDDVYAQIIQCSLLRASRRFSLAEHKAPKLFRSRTKILEIEQLLRTDWKENLKEFLRKNSLEVLRRLRDLAQLTKENDCRVIAIAGVDAASENLTDSPEVELIVTSPPYLQAQEYIRTFKVDLFWLGYSNEMVKKISQMEIPYRKTSEQFYSTTYLQVYNQIEHPNLREIMNSYFYYTTLALRNAAAKLKRNGYFCVFIGNSRIDGIEVEIWRIIAEYFEENGFKTINVYRDDIIKRQLFRRRRNKNPEGIQSEFLLVMRKESVWN